VLNPHSRFEPFTDQSDDPLISNPVFEKPEHPLVIDFVEERGLLRWKGYQ